MYFLADVYLRLLLFYYYMQSMLDNYCKADYT